MMTLWLFSACGIVWAPAEPSADTPAAAAPLAPLPEDSLYRIPIPLTRADGSDAPLGVHRGHPTIISMFYASCPTACPMLVSEIQSLEARMPEADRADLRVLLVSLDPARDDAAALTEAAGRYGVDTSRWVLTRTEPEHVRTLAALLSIRYRDLPDGEMNHSSILTALDRQGRIVKQEEGLGRGHDGLLAALVGI